VGASGTTASDSATVSGSSGTPTGSVTFTLYSGTSPTGTATGYTNTQTLNGSGSATSTVTGTLTPGSYYFLVSYTATGSTYSSITQGSPEPFTIPPVACTSGCGGGGGGSPTDSLSTTPDVVGLSATDVATVTGSAATPTGTVTFVLYSGTPGSGKLVSGFAADTVTLNGSGSATSVSSGNLPSGSYYFLVTYGGDVNYSAITVGTPEPFTINPTLTTTPTVTGTSATDTANLTGTGGTPTGTVTFTLYSGTPGSGTLVASYAPETVALVNGTATSTSTGTLAAGNYYFLVSYSGDSNYPAITPGTPEPFTIIVTNPPAPPKFKIPTSAPQTGAGGMAGVTHNGGLLALGGLMLLAGLSAMALLLGRRRNA